jgi:hypothetical protein
MSSPSLQLAIYLNDQNLDILTEENVSQSHEDVLQELDVSQNVLLHLPPWIANFQMLQILDISNNRLEELPEEICKLHHLTVLQCRNNLLRTASFPKHFGDLLKLRVLNISGNKLTEIPLQFYDLLTLEELFLGGNELYFIHADIARLTRLTMLYLGGNVIRALPPHVGYLPHLKYLNLCDNRLQTLPSTLGSLGALQTLSLHNNELQVLPPEILNLTQLHELSLRNNPLVGDFVRHIDWEVPTLKELSGRCILVHRVGYNRTTLPPPLITYLSTARECVNPACRGVYFTHCAQKVEFVDFCGKYRLPLLRYLCNANCCENYPRHSTAGVPQEEVDRLQQRVLLGGMRAE